MKGEIDNDGFGYRQNIDVEAIKRHLGQPNLPEVEMIRLVNMLLRSKAISSDEIAGLNLAGVRLGKCPEHGMILFEKINDAYICPQAVHQTGNGRFRDADEAFVDKAPLDIRKTWQ